MQVTSLKTRIFKEGEDLISFVLENIKKVEEDSILVITSKVVSLSEDRILEYSGLEDRIKIIQKESDFQIKGNNLFTIKQGIVMAFAGVDESNGAGKLILLPKDSYKSAEVLREKIMQKLGLKNFGVIITDSNFIPLRNGAVGVALGYAGFHGIRNYVGKKDIFGRVLKMSRTNVADSLASSAVVCMGEGEERQPLALITDAPVIFTDKIKKSEMKIKINKDMFAPLFSKLKNYGKK